MRIAVPTNENRQIRSRAFRRVAFQLVILLFFAFLNSSYSQLPLSTGAPYVGQKAPSFSLPDQHGKPVSLAEMLKPAAGGNKSGGLALIFYRGYW